MNKRNIEKLARHLDRVPRRGFDMAAWITPPNPNEYVDVEDLKKAAANSYKCGMAACVGGHAALLFGKVGDSFVKTVDKKLEICREHSFELTRHDADHQTPKAAARYLRKLARENPECCR